MKKVLLFAGMAALMAACSNEELVPNEVAGGVDSAAKGIVFETAPLEETRGELTIDGEAHNFFWYAEQDRINVYASNVEGFTTTIAGADGTSTIVGNTNNVGVADAGFSTLSPAVYKATQSAGQGRFTAIDDSNWIKFINGKEVAVIATYPAGVTTVTSVQATTETKDGITVTKEIKRVDYTTKIGSEQTVGYNETTAPMISKKVGHKRNADYESVGEKLPLQFRRPFPVLKFSGVANNDTFNDDLGNLESITLTMKGDEKTGNDHKLDASKIAGDAIVTNGVLAVSNDAHEAKVNVTGGKWQSKDCIYMAILPADRKKDNVDYSENYTVTYKYANVTLKQNYSTSNSWTEEHQVYRITPLDIEDKFPYIVTDPDANTSKRKLIVNKGNFADVFKKNDASKVMWNTEEINASDIDKVEIRANVSALTSGDFNKLNGNFSALKELKIKNSTTTVPRNALNNLGSLETLDMQNVTEIKYNLNDNPINSTNLKTVIMPKYDFSTNRQLTESILNKNKLVELNMCGVASMKEAYPKDGMSLKGYTLLQTVHVQDNVVLGPESFYGCSALNYVDGYVQLGGYGAFQNCTSLEWVRINESTKIYDYTFSGATSLNNVMKSNWSGIQPTEIGVSAFENANSLENIDLTATVTIKSGAFKNATALKGIEDKSKGLYALTVNAATIGAEAFSECKSLEYICFSNLEKVERNLLAYSSTTVSRNLQEVKFGKKITFGAGVAVVNPTTFGTSNNVKLFINPAQTYVGQKLYLGQTSDKTDVYQTFKTIIEE